VPGSVGEMGSGVHGRSAGRLMEPPIGSFTVRQMTGRERREANVRDRHVKDAAPGGRRWPLWTASVVGVGRGLWLFPLDVTFKTVGLRYGWLKMLFERTPAWILAGLGQLRAERAAWRAVRNVPAYRRFLQDAGVRGRSLYPLGILARLPETDKRSYVDRFGFLERCVDGSVPYPGTTIDESSGSTGTPYNWIRAASPDARAACRRDSRRSGRRLGAHRGRLHREHAIERAVRVGRDGTRQHGSLRPASGAHDPCAMSGTGTALEGQDRGLAMTPDVLDGADATPPTVDLDRLIGDSTRSTSGGDR